MANEAEKKVEKVVEGTKELVKQTKDVKQEQFELKKKIDQSTESYNKALEAMKNYTNGSFRGLGQIIQSIACI